VSNRQMVRTLVIGDLHFDNKPMGLLQAQTGTTIEIYNDACKSGPIDDVIFLGDLMMHRKPYPRVLLALKEVIDYISKRSSVYILRGNHDSENKSDDGVTALSLFESNRVKILTQITVDEFGERVFIPHYEDETKIKKALGRVPKGYRVFGHFGYFGALNSAGDADFSIAPSELGTTTFLGHIHKFNQRTFEVEGSVETVTLLGTPYTTNFSEAKKDSFYAIIENDDIKIYPVEFGPRHLVIDYDKVEENLDWINDPNYFTLLRINLHTVDKEQDGVAALVDKLNVGYTEVKYKPLIDDREDSNELNLINPIIDINDKIIEDYINISNTTISKEKLMGGLQLIHENQQDRD